MKIPELFPSGNKSHLSVSLNIVLFASFTHSHYLPNWLVVGCSLVFVALVLQSHLMYRSKGRSVAGAD